MSGGERSGCKRNWEVEAARDGRLSGSDRTSIERHMLSCEACSEEAERLEELAGALRALPVSQPDELGIRRARQALLTRAYEQQSEQAARPWVPWRTALGVALACAALVLAARLVSTREATAAVTLEPASGARYASRRDGERETVQLRAGQMTFRVRSTPGHSQILVQTPDAEIEDVGTVFSVVVTSGRTESVSVAEGRVVVRMAGRPEHWVSAGEIHRPYAAVAAPKIAESTRPEVPSERADEPPLPAITALRSRVQRRAKAAPTRGQPVAESAPDEQREQHAPELAASEQPASRQPDAATSAPRSAATALFERALARVEARDEAQASALLSQFVRDYPDDVHAEDAAFLRVVVLARLGHDADARAAGDRYLARYPSGFRAPDVRQLLRGVADSKPEAGAKR